MLKYEFLEQERIIILKPEARKPMTSEDFRSLTSFIDPLIECGGPLSGVLFDAPSFPGWKNPQALIAHAIYVKNHHQHVCKVAVATESQWLVWLQRGLRHFVRPDLRVFEYSRRKEAFDWLSGSEKVPNEPCGA